MGWNANGWVENQDGDDMSAREKERREIVSSDATDRR